MPRPVLQYSKLPFNEQSICRSPFSLVCSPPDDSRKGFPAEQTFLVFPLASPCPNRTPPPRISGGEKISCEGGPAVSCGFPKTFSPRGEGPQGSPRGPPVRACAQSCRRSAGHRRRFCARVCHSSRAVFRLWQEWHRLSRLLRSQKTAQSPLWSVMWSTSVALVRIPLRAHSRQNGSFSSCVGRRSLVHSSVRYIQCHDCASSLRLPVRLGR